MAYNVEKLAKLGALKELGLKQKAVDEAQNNRITALEDVGAQANVLEGVKVNGVALAIAEKMVDILVATGSKNGSISVAGTDVAIKGLAALAYKAKISQSDLDDALAAVLAAKADKATTLGGYGITDAYTKSETDTLLESYRKKTTVDFIGDTGETTVLLAEEYLPVISGYTALTITLPAGSESDGIEYNIQFTAPDEGLVLNVPDTIKWNGGLEPVINSGSTYQISILNNLAVIGEF